MQPKRRSHYAHTVAMTLISITIAITISGCATPYKEPTGDSVASIEFIDETSQPMSVHMHGDSKECTDRTNTGGVQAKSERKLVVPANQDVVFTVGMDPKGTNFALMFGAVGALIAANTHLGCTPTIDFVPEVGRTYIFRMNTDSKNCSYQFYAKPSANQRPEEATPVAFTEREWIRAATEAGPFCKKK